MGLKRANTAQREEVVRRVRTGEFKQDLAREFGVSVGTIYEWTKGVKQIAVRPSEYPHPLYLSKEIREEAIRRVRQGEGKTFIARALGVSVTTIYKWTEKLESGETKKSSRRKHLPTVRSEVLQRLEQGESKRLIAEEMGIPLKTVRSWTIGMGDIKQVYTAETKAKALERIISGETKIAVAESMGISIGTIQNWTTSIVRNKKIPNAIKIEAKKRAERGESRKKISQDLNISKDVAGQFTSKFGKSDNQKRLSQFVERIKQGEMPVPLTRSLNISIKKYHRLRKQGELDILIPEDLSARILAKLKEKESIFQIALDLQVPVHQLRILKRQYEGKSPNRPEKGAFAPEIKLQAAKAVEAGESLKDVAKKFGTSYASVNNWVKQAVLEKKITLTVPRNKSDDPGLTWISLYHPELEDWRIPLSEWLRGESRSIGGKLSSVTSFISKYLSLPTVPKKMSMVLQRGVVLPDLYEELLKSLAPSNAIKQYNSIRYAVDWILLSYFSEGNDFDNERVILPGMRNPFPALNSAGTADPQLDESIRDVLPYGYIVQLREMLASGPTFSDWTIAQSAIGFETPTGSRNSQTDWYVVPENRIDKADPNCVWRVRERLGKPPVLEMWSPVRWVAVLIKLQTVARTGMVRMLDSGESDTYRFENNTFVSNPNELAKINGKKLWQQGVFRRNTETDSDQNAILYFNTNKTKDSYKSGPEKGYECPWPAFKNISENPYYWLEVLRNWQEKYNPIARRTPWTAIPSRRALGPKSDIAKAGYPNTCFLFRTPEDKGCEDMPVSNSVVSKAWRNLLRAFDQEMARKGVTHPDGSAVKLNQVADGKTRFPLHGLRVSLITALVVEGGIAPELMMKIVGHSRIIMLLYYTKPGLSQLRDALANGAQLLDADKESSILRFLSDATEKDMTDRIAFNTADWSTVIPINPAYRNAAGWLLLHDGICFAGGNTGPLDGDAKVPGCHNGGPLRKSSTSEYDPVPGGPMNCSRCRWKAAEKRHGPALVATFNNQAYHLMVEQEAAIKLTRRTTALKKERARLESLGELFTEMRSLREAERQYEASIARMADLAASLGETYKMIVRVKQLPDVTGGNIAVAAAGDLLTMNIVLDHTDSELLQLAGICGDVELYPDLLPGSAVYRRSQILDAALKREGTPPFFMQLSESDQLIYGNAFMASLSKLADPRNPLNGLRMIVRTIDDAGSIGELLGIKLQSALPKLSADNTVVILSASSGGGRS